VILDIFATRAKSHEAKIQVELAQLEYLLPRLTRIVDALVAYPRRHRVAGAGRKRSSKPTAESFGKRFPRCGVVSRRWRTTAPTCGRAGAWCRRRALVGLYQCRKSSLLKAALGRDVFVEDRLFATLDTLTREVDVGEGYRFRVTDTVAHPQAAASPGGRRFGRHSRRPRTRICCCT